MSGMRRGAKVGPGRLWSKRLPDGWTQTGRGRWAHASGATVEDTGDSCNSGRKYAATDAERERRSFGVRADALAWAAGEGDREDSP